MIDFGLVALVVLLLLLVGATWRAYDGIKQDMRPISAIKNEQESIREAIAATMDRIDKLDTDHYKALLKRVNDAEDAAAADRRRFSKIEDNIQTLQSKLGAFKRWNKKAEEETETPATTQDLFSQPPAAEPPKSSFGRKAA